MQKGRNQRGSTLEKALQAALGAARRLYRIVSRQTYLLRSIRSDPDVGATATP